MRTATVDVYQFGELSDKAKERARDWYRECIDSDEYSAVTEDAQALLELLGFSDIKIYWSGFSSQGDGASFEAGWSAYKCNSEEFFGHCPETEGNEEYCESAKRIIALATEFPELTARLETRGNYSHSGTMRADLGDSPDGVEERFISACRDFADAIYSALERENEYLYSEESVDENIRANEYEFTADGKRWTRN